MWWFFYSQISEETWKRPPEILSKYKESISGDILTDENAHASHSHMRLLQTAPLLIQTQNQTHTDSVVASNESSFPSKIAAVAWITTSGRAALGVSARQSARKSWAGKWRGNGRLQLPGGDARLQKWGDCKCWSRDDVLLTQTNNVCPTWEKLCDNNKLDRIFPYD